MFKRKNYRQINYAMLLHVMGLLLIIESCFMLVPCAVSLAYREVDTMTFLYTFLITFAAGYGLFRFVKPVQRSMGRREGFLLTASVWVVFSIFGMLPFIFSPAPYNVAEAYTESMSCFTTTGAEVVPSAEILSHGVNVWRAMMQWIGGMGIILFTLAILPTLNYSGGMQMFNAEVTGITHDKIRPRISQTAKSLWATYTLMTLVLLLLLWAGPVDFFDSVTHSLVTVATGGISYYNDGIEHFSSRYVKVVITVFMFLGSISFNLIYSASHGNWRALVNNGQLRFMLKVLAVGVVLFLISEYNSGAIENFFDSVLDSLFMVVSAMSTTCFALSGIDRWGYLALCVIICLMFFGGCAGSTSGGAKIDRMMVLLKNSRNEVWRALQPNSVATVKIGRTTIGYNLVQKSIAFLCIDVMVIVVLSGILSLMRVPLGDAFFLSVSSISNSGLIIDHGTFGGSLVQLPDAGKLLLSCAMLIGRLEFFTILVLFTRNFWHK